MKGICCHIIIYRLLGPHFNNQNTDYAASLKRVVDGLVYLNIFGMSMSQNFSQVEKSCKEIIISNLDT